MYFGIYKQEWYCRWCGLTYNPKKQTDRDGFCCPAHKQALHRAYKKYVTATRSGPGPSRNAGKRRRRKK